ncbi:MAG: lipopolysaccharide biosynthesis protein [Myxococcaceae bacterium]
MLGRAGPLVLARLFAAGLTFAIPLVLARVLNLEDYGTYKQLILISTTLYMVLPFGMAQSLYFFIPRTEERRAYFFQTLVFLAVAGLAAVGLIFTFADVLASRFSNPGIFEHRVPLALYAGALIAGFPLEISLTSQGRTTLSAKSYLFWDGLRTAAMVIPILLGFGLSGLMVSLAGLMGLRLLVTWIAMMKLSGGPVFRPALFWSQVAYAAPFGAAMCLNYPQQAAHQYMVSATVAPELFALYAVGCFQLPLVDLLYTPTSEVLMVQLGENEKRGEQHLDVAAFRQATANLAYAFLPLGAFLFAAAPELISTLFGAKFLPAVPLFRISVLGTVMAILPMDGVLRARNQTRHIFRSYLVKALVTVPMVYFGVKTFGMMGGLGSWAIAELVGKGLLLSRIPAALSTTLRAAIPWSALWKAGLAAVAAAAVVALLRQISPPAVSPSRVVPLLAAGTLFATGYVGVLWLTGVRPTALLSSLRRRRLA